MGRVLRGYSTCGRETKSCHPVRMIITLPEQQGTGTGELLSCSHGTQSRHPTEDKPGEAEVTETATQGTKS